jgi:hypothetical protein
MLRWPEDCPDLFKISNGILLEEYTRLADDGCPNCPSHVTMVDPRWVDFMVALVREMPRWSANN